MADYKDVTIQSMMKGFQAMSTRLAAMLVIAEEKPLFLLTDRKELAQERDELEGRLRAMDEECCRLEAERSEALKQAENSMAETVSERGKAYRLKEALHRITNRLKACEEESQ